MFGLLKEKLKKAVSIFTKKVEEKAEEEVREEPVKAKQPVKIKEEVKVKKAEKPRIEKIKEGHKKIEEKATEKPKGVYEEKKAVEKPKEEKKAEEKSFFGKLKGIVTGEKVTERKVEELKVEAVKEPVKEVEKGFFETIKEKIVTKKISEKQFDELFWELELAMLENNVAVEVIEKIKDDLKKNLVNTPLRKSQIEEIITESLKKSISMLFNVPQIDLIKTIKEKKENPFIIVFVGVNGAGKTTTIAKIARLLLDNKLSCVLVAADTWRAASIEQLEHHGRSLGVKVVKHKYGSDPAAVAFDGIAMAKARGIDAVLIDTAGRQHSNTNLIMEMEKIIRVTKPDLKLFIGESITGNDCVEQLKRFNEAINIDGVILSKADVDEKGGAAISISYVSGKPILYLGTGQGLTDLKKFDKTDVIKNLGL